MLLSTLHLLRKNTLVTIVLSRRLAGVTFPAFLEGDTAPPAKLAGLTEKDRQHKEAKVFNRAMKQLVGFHWAGVEFNGCAVTTKCVPCQNDCSSVLTGLSDVKIFIKAPLRRMESGTNKNVLRDMKVLQKHLSRKSNDRGCFHEV